jgi:hypothetical protein
MLAFSMILVLLAVRLGSLRDEVFSTPVEDAIFGNAFVTTEDNVTQTRLIAVKFKCAFESNLPLHEVSLLCPQPVATIFSPYVPLCLAPEVAFEIFIPPESPA